MSWEKVIIWEEIEDVFSGYGYGRVDGDKGGKWRKKRKWENGVERRGPTFRRILPCFAFIKRRDNRILPKHTFFIVISTRSLSLLCSAIYPIAPPPHHTNEDFDGDPWVEKMIQGLRMESHGGGRKK